MLEQLSFYYPACHLLGVLFAIYQVVVFPKILTWISLVFVSYLLSPLLWVLVRIVFKGARISGAFRVGKATSSANAWLIYYHLQSVYSHFSVFERLLRLIPGAYSFWLRLWGSKIGRGVNWTPECQIMDRGHLKIGDRAFLGNRSYLSAHAMKKSGSTYILFVKPIKVGADVMISFDCKIGPGVEIGHRAHVEACSKLYLNHKVMEGDVYV